MRASHSPAVMRRIIWVSWRTGRVVRAATGKAMMAEKMRRRTAVNETACRTHPASPKQPGLDRYAAKPAITNVTKMKYEIAMRQRIWGNIFSNQWVGNQWVGNQWVSNQWVGNQWVGNQH
ncbi:MAG: hypothetical protein IPJ90_19260 [Anaerolineaceae bacterium]|nr:hypothetical protein [Anaerolineaceae bacterium]